MNQVAPQTTDVLIIGGGAAGLSAAIRLAETRNVTLALKGDFPGGASFWAQGGIAVAIGADDSLESHVADTLEVGAGICKRETVQFCVEGAREQLDWLLAQGVKFTQESNAPGESHLHLTREGGHSFRRIVHSDDATGAAIQSRLTEVARALPRLTVLTQRVAVDLIRADGRCVGAYLYNEATRKVETWASHAVVLATGGASRAWLYSTNPDVASGDGIAMGWRAGCRVANLEFNQFHPTCLYAPGIGKSGGESKGAGRNFLLTEALRGEGAYLRLPDAALNNERFMLRYHPAAELAPRDVVARSIDAEMKRHGLDYVHLDIRHRPPEFVRAHFPTIYAHCQNQGIDLTKDCAPVVPAAHYTCGGLVTDLHGATDVPGLYAVGEVACTGLHGANRIASNSLLECFVFGTACARHILSHFDSHPLPATLPEWDESRVMESDEAVVVTHNWAELRRTMWNYVGIVRTQKRLARAAARIALLSAEVADYYANCKVNRNLLELRNLVQVSELIVRCAQQRKESRGLHFLADHPDTDPAAAHDTVLIP